MTNWTPSPDHISSLVRAVNFLTNKRATMMEADYPLTLAQVIAVTTPLRLKELIALGYDSLQQTYHISYELGPEHGMARRSVTNVSLPDNIHYAYNRQLRPNYDASKPIFFNREAIDDETMAKLKTWTDTAVYERRLAALVVDTVTMFFKHRDIGEPLTMYHIMARWPAIKVVFPHIDYGYGARGRDMWEKHGNAVGRDLHRWGWPQWGTEAAWREKYKKRLLLTEETLLSCVSLPKPKQESYRSHEFRATLSDWQKLGDQPF